MKFQESRAIYLQIVERLYDEIVEEKCTEEERIPSVREYAMSLKVNPNTVMRAYDQLQGDHVIYNKRGIGFFVSRGARCRVLNLKRKRFMQEELNEFFRSLEQLEISMEEIMTRYQDYPSKKTNSHEGHL